MISELTVLRSVTDRMLRATDIFTLYRQLVKWKSAGVEVFILMEAREEGVLSFIIVTIPTIWKIKLFKFSLDSRWIIYLDYF